MNPTLRAPNLRYYGRRLSTSQVGISPPGPSILVPTIRCAAFQLATHSCKYRSGVSRRNADSLLFVHVPQTFSQRSCRVRTHDAARALPRLTEIPKLVYGEICDRKA